MTIEHVNIDNANLHEPKDVSASAVNKVYVANGAGSGVWQLITSSQVSSGAATLGQHLLADGSGGATFADAPGSIHGEMEISGNSTATTISASATFVKVSQGTPSGDHLNGITFDTDHLVIPVDGTYAVFASVSFEGDAGDIFRFDVAIDASLTPMNHVARRKTPNADVGHIMTGGMHTLTAGDQISIIVQNEAATTNPTITDAVLVVYKISE